MKRVVLLICVCVALAACGSEPAAALPPGAPANIAPVSRLLDTRAEAVEGQPAPDFSFTMADGSTTRLSDLRGKKVVLNFWATWCTPCREEMPDLQAASAANPDDLVIIGVNKGEDPTLIPGFIQEIPVSFPLVADVDGDIALAYGVVSGIPQTFFINSDGTLAKRYVSILTAEALETQLAALK